MLAQGWGMAPRRAHQAAIAVASDGSVLINVVGLLPDDVQDQLGLALGTTQLFVGVPLGQREAADVVARLDGAAAEASAHLLGSRRRPLAVSPGPAKRTGAKAKAKPKPKPTPKHR